jgi:hypothetical protein
VHTLTGDSAFSDKAVSACLAQYCTSGSAYTTAAPTLQSLLLAVQSLLLAVIQSTYSQPKLYLGLCFGLTAKEEEGPDKLICCSPWAIHSDARAAFASCSNRAAAGWLWLDRQTLCDEKANGLTDAAAEPFYLWVWVWEVCDALLVWLHLVTLVAVE